MKKILIVEDDSRLALALSIRLKANGYATWIAADSIIAMTTAVRVKPDLVLLDITLPAGNGFTLLEQFGEFEETRQTPIILTTASKDPELRRKSIDMGAAGLLRKPYEPDELIGIVKQVLERWDGPGSVRGLVSDDCGASIGTFKKVLIIEDDENIASALSIRMGAAGYQTTVANDAMSGLRCAVNNKPDMVILDISLPAGDGFSVAERIHENIPDPVRIIFLTASKRLDFRERAEELGAVGFFEKPYEPEALMDAVEQALSSSGENTN
jgi:DNA-binding response OmpR family regulator